LFLVDINRGSFCCSAGRELRRWSFMLLWNKCNSPTVFLHKGRWIIVLNIKVEEMQFLLLERR